MPARVNRVSDIDFAGASFSLAAASIRRAKKTLRPYTRRRDEDDTELTK
jgi:hypothetical protein